MEIFDGHYYQSCKRFMSICGLWPYQKDKRRYLTSVGFYLLSATLAVPQLILLAQKFGKDIIVTFENTVSVMFSMGVVAKYAVTFISKERLSLLLMQISKDWQRLTDIKEREILTRNTAQGRFLLIIYTYYLFAAWILYTLMPFLPVALDLILPLNQSRPVLMPFYANYVFIDQTDYHYTSCCHIAVVYLTCFSLFSGTDTTYVISVKHTCGLFEIVCHRLENLVDIGKEKEPKELIDDKKIINNIRAAIQLHNETIRCCDLLESSFNVCFLMVNCMSVVGLALCAVYVYILLFIFEEIFKSIRIIAFVIGLIMHLLYLNWVGQQIIDSSEQVFLSAYSSNWYFASNKARKMINIILARSLTPCTLTAGKLSTLCMESFGILLKTSVSYCTVILSVSE